MGSRPPSPPNRTSARRPRAEADASNRNRSSLRSPVSRSVAGRAAPVKRHLWRRRGEAGKLRRTPNRQEIAVMAARLRHIALCVKDIDATADFYEKAFDMTRTKKHEGKTAYAVYMSDGEVNLALLQYKGEEGSGVPK